MVNSEAGKPKPATYTIGYVAGEGLRIMFRWSVGLEGACVDRVVSLRIMPDK